MLIALVDIADLLLTILSWIIIGQVILSWLLALNVLNTSSGGVRAFAMAIDRITAPIMPMIIYTKRNAATRFVR